MPYSEPVLITVAGHIGSGKSAVCKLLSERTGWELVYAGAIMRKLAAEQGMTVLDFNSYAKLNTDIDLKIDQYLAGLAEGKESKVIDSRLAWHFLPGSLKVYLIVEPIVAAERVFGATRSAETHASIETACVDNAERARIERERFQGLYGIDVGQWRNYDLLVDTTSATPEQVTEQVLRHVAEGPFGEKPVCWLSPQRLIPVMGLTGKEGNALDVPEVAFDAGFVYLLNGHAACGEALRRKDALLRCRVVAFDGERLPSGSVTREYVASQVSGQSVGVWEKEFGFQFRARPEWLS